MSQYRLKKEKAAMRPDPQLVQIVDGIIRPVPWDRNEKIERALGELTGRVLEDEGVTTISLADLRELGLLRLPEDGDA
jgi:hypothetical protein